MFHVPSTNFFLNKCYMSTAISVIEWFARYLWTSQKIQISLTNLIRIMCSFGAFSGPLMSESAYLYEAYCRVLKSPLVPAEKWSQILKWKKYLLTSASICYNFNVYASKSDIPLASKPSKTAPSFIEYYFYVLLKCMPRIIKVTFLKSLL